MDADVFSGHTARSEGVYEMQRKVNELMKRETDRQRQTEAEAQRDRGTERQIETDRDRQRQRQTDRGAIG